MTDPDAPTAKLPPTPRKRVAKPGPLPVIAGSFGLFFAITSLLAFQMRRGADPALGKPQPQAVAAAPAPRQILVRRVIVTRIVETRRDDGRPRATGRRGTAPATTTGGAAQPAPAAPAPAAPAPAPLTTRSS